MQTEELKKWLKEQAATANADALYYSEHKLPEVALGKMSAEIAFNKVLAHIDAEEKAKKLSEDAARTARDKTTDLVHQHEREVNEVLEHKTQEIMEV